jgi:ATP-dependent DNA ligase
VTEDEPVLPQRARAANAVVASVEWLFEPAWRGDRLLARYDTGRVGLTDEEGRSADDRFPEAAEILGNAILANQALIDGIWTAQPFIGDGSAARHWADTLESEGLADEIPDPIERERRRAFVAIDLIELDGELLHEIPFQERRRILESVLDEGVQVRVSPTVKQPISAWLVGWRANGFSHYLAKHQNSRYHPGEVNDDWLQISVAAEPVRGMVSRMFGMRDEKPRRISELDTRGGPR